MTIHKIAITLTTLPDIDINKQLLIQINVPIIKHY